MASITRANPYLEEIVTHLDQHLAKHNGDVGIARDRLTKSDNEFIDEELVKCMGSARYFISNYYAYRDEKEGFKGLYPFFDSQEILHNEYRRLEGLYGKVRALVLKARQMGSTTYNCAEFFHKTIFAEHNNAIIVGQHEKQAGFIYGMYSSALDFIPWWMKPRIKSQVTGVQIEFDEKDPALRATKPGLKTTIYADNANKPSGVGRGMTFNKALMSELAFWEDGGQLSKSLFPTMNTPDGFYVMESTANGRNDFWHNLWRRAESGKVDWHPIFIPFYRREATYSLPILKTTVFVLNEEEEGMKERIFEKEGYLIKNETFNWMRNKKEEFIATDGDDSMFSQEYTSEPEESFQSSAITAFPRGIIRRMSKLTSQPTWIGEINYDPNTGGPELHLKEVVKGTEVQYPEGIGTRFHVWRRPARGSRYCIGVDVSLGNPGGDYSCIQVLKLSDAAGERHEQVAVWHGLINPTALAGVICAIGTWYNEALAAVEVNSYGMSTNSMLMRDYEYDNVYRFKRLDRIQNFITNIAGFLSTPSSTDAYMSSMSTALLEDEIIINDKYTMDEFNDYTDEGAKGDGAHDDYVDGLCIALYCGTEGEARARREGKPKKVNENANNFKVKDRFGTVIAETTSQQQAEHLSKKHVGSYIDREAGATAMITIAGRRAKVPADYANTDHSPIHDKTGTAHRLHYEEGVEEELITAEMIADFEEAEESNEADPDAWKYQ